MERSDDSPNNIIGYMCHKCGAVAYTSGYIRDNRYTIKTIVAKELKKKKIEGDLPIYCEMCLEQDKQVLIGYTVEGKSASNLPRFCPDCKRIRNKEAGQRFTKKHGKKRSKKKLPNISYSLGG